ncbi:hypothetical protein ACN42_g2227 [Penicillium freii]|uniref:Uncharacterized protein n=1 Tax=Penicillium freii TaxID=48697 RepID=A0A101MQG9_PENFR|nr:hypothetical protein ACN42_g2227 [Penicillium freii]
MLQSSSPTNLPIPSMLQSSTALNTSINTPTNHPVHQTNHSTTRSTNQPSNLTIQSNHPIQPSNPTIQSNHPIQPTLQSSTAMNTSIIQSNGPFSLTNHTMPSALQ